MAPSWFLAQKAVKVSVMSLSEKFWVVLYSIWELLSLLHNSIVILYAILVYMGTIILDLLSRIILCHTWIIFHVLSSNLKKSQQRIYKYCRRMSLPMFLGVANRCHFWHFRAPSMHRFCVSFIWTINFGGPRWRKCTVIIKKIMSCYTSCRPSANKDIRRHRCMAIHTNVYSMYPLVN